VMVVVEWKRKGRFLTAIGAMVCLGVSTWVGTLHIIPVNKILKTHIADQARLTELLEKWMSLNEIRWVAMTLCWALMMWYFGAATVETREARS